MPLRILSSIALLLISSAAFSQLESKKSDDGKFGFTNDGVWTIQPVYDEVTEFYDGPYAFVKMKGKWGIINQQGKVIVPFEFSKISNLDVGQDQLYAVVKDKRYGLLSLQSGKLIADCVYEKEFMFNDGIIPRQGNLSVVYKNKKAGLVNEKGIEIVPCIYDGGKRPFAELDFDAYFLVRQKNLVGVIDTSGTQVVPCLYEKIKICDSMEKTFEVVINGKNGMCAFDGKVMIEPIYDKPFFFEGEYSLVKFKGNYGVINKEGKTVMPFTYSKETDAFNEMMKLYK
jgi:WG containing repeat